MDGTERNRKVVQKMTRNETVVKYLPWLRKRAWHYHRKYDDGFTTPFDAVQDGCLALMKSYDDGKWEPFQYLYVDGAIRSHYRNYLARKERNNDIYEEGKFGKHNHPCRKIDLKDAIGKLDKEMRGVIMAYYYGDMSDNEIARIKGISRSTVQEIRDKAIRRLHEILH